MKHDLKKLAISALVPLSVGGLSAFLTRDSVALFSQLKQPPLSPPSQVFGIVWPVLYGLMALSSYSIWTSAATTVEKGKALLPYLAQLAFNFVWPILFFNLGWFSFAFVWLLALIGLVVWMIKRFFSISPLAGALQVPYLLWLVFAGYLNLMIDFYN